MDEPLSFFRCRIDRFSLRVKVLHLCYFFVVFRNEEFCNQDRVNFDSVSFHLQYTLDSWLEVSRTVLHGCSRIHVFQVRNHPHPDAIVDRRLQIGSSYFIREFFTILHSSATF